MLADVTPHILLRPCGERSDLGDAAMELIATHRQGARTRRRLLAAQTCDPCVVVAQCACQRAHLSYLAALVSQLDGAPKQIRAVGGGHAFHLRCVGRKDAEPYRVTLSKFIEQS